MSLSAMVDVGWTNQWSVYKCVIMTAIKSILKVVFYRYWIKIEFQISLRYKWNSDLNDKICFFKKLINQLSHAHWYVGF